MAAELSVEALRAEIDQIDEVLVRLLDSRARCAYAIGRVKHSAGKKVYEPSREAAVLAHVRDVMLAALAEGGTSFDALYVNVNGQSGYFDRRLAAYGQEGMPCPRCGTPIRRTAFMNRSSYFCPQCQS